MTQVRLSGAKPSSKDVFGQMALGGFNQQQDILCIPVRASPGVGLQGGSPRED